MHLVVTFGISGAGKSHVSRGYERLGYTRVNPDDIRLELSGDISDQSQGKKVFDLAYARTAEALAQEKDVIFDSTALAAKTRKGLLKIAKEAGAETILVVLTSSSNPKLCASRVRRDLQQGVVRSNTLSDETIIEKQYNKYIENLKLIEKEGWDTILQQGPTA